MKHFSRLRLRIFYAKKGKEVETSVDELRHYAEDAGESEEEMFILMLFLVIARVQMVLQSGMSFQTRCYSRGLPCFYKTWFRS